MKFWQIVPTNDGYHYITIDEHGAPCTVEKVSCPDTFERLHFCSQEDAETYIKNHSLTNCKAEPFWIGEKIYEKWENKYEQT